MPAFGWRIVYAGIVCLEGRMTSTVRVFAVLLPGGSVSGSDTDGITLRCEDYA